MIRRCASHAAVAVAVTVAWAFGWWLVVIGIVSSVSSIFLIDRDNDRRLARQAYALARHVPSGTVSPTEAETVVVSGIVAIAADDPTVIQIARRRVESIFDPWRRSLAVEPSTRPARRRPRFLDVRLLRWQS